MKPLQTVAMGFVIIALFARVGDFDLLADPVGWLLVLGGVRLLPEPIGRKALTGLGLLALVVSVPIWVPDVAAALAREDESLAWTADLPAFVFTALLFHQLGAAATAGRDRRAARVCAGLVTFSGAVAVLPVLVFGAGWSELATTASTAAEVFRLAIVVTLFAYAGRAWARTPILESAAKPPDSS